MRFDFSTIHPQTHYAAPNGAPLEDALRKLLAGEIPRGIPSARSPSSAGSEDSSYISPPRVCDSCLQDTSTPPPSRSASPSTAGHATEDEGEQEDLCDLCLHQGFIAESSDCDCVSVCQLQAFIYALIELIWIRRAIFDCNKCSAPISK